MGDLEISHVHLTPSTSGEGVMVSFSTNVETNNMIAVQYGTTEDLGYEAFASRVKVCRYIYTNVMYVVPQPHSHKIIGYWILGSV